MLSDSPVGQVLELLSELQLVPSITTGIACKPQHAQHMQCAALHPNVAKTPFGSSAAIHAGLQAHFLQEEYLQADPVWHETPAVSSAAHLADWTLPSVHPSLFVAVCPETQSQVSLANQ